MDKKPKQIRNLLDELGSEDLAKIKAHRVETEGAMPVDTEWLIMAEWLRLAGWEGYMAVKNDEISLAEVLTLIEANRKLEARRIFEDMQASFVGAVSAQTKKPTSTFKSLTKNIIKQTKVDD